MRRLAAALAGLALALPGLVTVLPDAAAAPLPYGPVVPAGPLPQATDSPDPSEDPSADPSASATASTSPSATPTTPRADPEGDRWVQLAVVGGGTLLGTVLVFMVIGSLLRRRNRNRYRG